MGNALRQNYEKTVIYDLTDGQKPLALADLKETLNANVSVTLPSWLAQPAHAEEPGLTDALEASTSDFIIILGEDQE